MGCLLVMLGAFFPRLGVFFIWLARPALFEAAIPSALVAVLSSTHPVARDQPGRIVEPQGRRFGGWSPPGPPPTAQASAPAPISAVHDGADVRLLRRGVASA